MRYFWLVVLLAFSTAYSGISQIVGFEYFIDSDPGVGKASAFSIGTGASVSGEFKVPLSSVSVGFHQLGVRTFDTSGKVSQTYLHPFYLLAPQSTEISEVEYFIDQDPGQGSGTKIPPSFDQNGYLNYTIPLSAVAEGHHLLGIRSKNKEGVWSQTLQWFFYNRPGHFPSHIVRLDYYFTGTDAPQKNYSYTLPEPSGSVDLETIVALADLQDGRQYTVHVTVIDEHGFRSNEVTATFSVSTKIEIENIDVVHVSCFGGSDGKATVTAKGGEQTLEYSLDGQTFVSAAIFDNLEAGAYTAYVRSTSNREFVVEETFTVNTPTQLTLSFQNVVNPGCPGDDTGSFSAIAAGGTSGYTYRLGDQGSFRNGNAFSDLAAGSYNVTVRDANGCEATAEVTLNPTGQIPPKPTVSIEGVDGISEELSLVSSATSGIQWIKDGEVIPGATEPRIQITEAGAYQVIVTGTGGCTTTSDIVAITSSPEIRTMSISLYPNPAEDKTNIRFSRNANIDRVAIYSATGILLRESREMMSVSNIELNLTGLSAGTYVVLVEGIGIVERVRLIKK